MQFDSSPNVVKVRKDNIQKNPRNWELWYYFLLVVFILLAGLRDYSIGGDTKNYVQFFEETPPLSDISDSYISDSRYQAIFIYLISFVKSINGEFFIAQLIHATIVNTLIFLFLEDKLNHCFFCALRFILSLTILSLIRK